MRWSDVSGGRCWWRIAIVVERGEESRSEDETKDELLLLISPTVLSDPISQVLPMAVHHCSFHPVKVHLPADKQRLGSQTARRSCSRVQHMSRQKH